MKKSRAAIAILNVIFLLLVFYAGHADEGQKEVPSPLAGYQVGDVVADFALKNINGKNVSLSDYKDRRGVVLVFTSNQCPFARAYEGRLIAMDSRFSGQGFPLVAINAGDASSDAESFFHMQERAKLKGFSFPYLQDETQRTAQLFGVSRAPQAFVLKNSGGKFYVQYIGAIDDNPQDPDNAGKRYVEDAVSNILQGKPVVTTFTKAIGCTIKFKSNR